MTNRARDAVLRMLYVSPPAAKGRRLRVVRTALCIGALALGMLTGCQPSAATAPAKSSASDQINVTTGDAKDLATLIASHKGQVVFVDCWATWCGPCVEGFPHTVALAQKYAPQGLATIAVSFDQLADEPKVRGFLDKQHAHFEHLLSRYDGVNQQAAVDFDVEALPQYRLYDRKGELRAKWEGQSDEIEQKIVQLLAENP